MLSLRRHIPHAIRVNLLKIWENIIAEICDNVIYNFFIRILAILQHLGSCDVPKAIVSGFEYMLPDEKISWSSEKNSGFRLNGHVDS